MGKSEDVRALDDRPFFAGGDSSGGDGGSFLGSVVLCGLELLGPRGQDEPVPKDKQGFAVAGGDVALDLDVASAT